MWWESKEGLSLREGGGDRWGVRNRVVVMDVCFVLGVSKISVQDGGDKEDLDFGW
jgi:hypothetical protein